MRENRIICFGSIPARLRNAAIRQRSIQFGIKRDMIKAPRRIKVKRSSVRRMGPNINKVIGSEIFLIF